MFVLLQVYPIVYPREVSGETDDGCSLSVIAVRPTMIELKRYLAGYQRRYKAACAAFDAWRDDTDWTDEEYNHKIYELQGEYNVYGALVSGARFKIVPCATGWPSHRRKRAA